VSEIVVVPGAEDRGPQDVPVQFGISRATAGSERLALNLTTFPPGGCTKAHLHEAHETAIYAVEGSVALFYGPRLERIAILHEGWFCLIPPGLPHKAYNLSDTAPSRFVSARDDPDEPEHVVPTPEADDCSADVRIQDLRRRHTAEAESAG
jgi:uncharacterized RmlC-like cupin family protein